ncbi:hypothetical protein RB595_003917 [Gaeumannomyces hyphopodioides]
MHRQIPSDLYNEFREWVEKHKLRGTCLVDPTQSKPEPRYFVPRKALEEYWTDDDNNRLAHLLDTLDLNVSLDSVREGLLCTLSTLLYISDKSCSRVRNIQHIPRDLETGILDKILPTDRGGRIKSAFPNDPDTANLFYDAQFLFCPVVPHWDINLPPDAVLPLDFVKVLQHGDGKSTPTLAKYKPYPDFELQDEFYVLKHFPPEEVGGSYAAERNMHRTLSLFNHKYSSDEPAQYFLKCNVAFRQNKRAALLLEYADGGSLEDMFHRHPPFTLQGVLDMWDELVKLLRALYSLHNMGVYTETTPVTYLHQDIKPENILVFWDPGDYEPSARGEYRTRKCYFKLADFGQSCEVKDTLNGAAPHNPGNRTYNAPVLFTHDKHVRSTGRPASRETDVWSMVCVLFETAVWIACGEPARLAFRHARIQENMANNSGLPAEGFQGSFHDGLGSLKALENARTQIERNSRTCDQITLEIVDCLLDNILRTPSCIPPADWISGRIQLIINKHKNGMNGTVVPVAPSTPNNSSHPPMSPPATGLRDSPDAIPGPGSRVRRPERRNEHQTGHGALYLETPVPLLSPDHRPSPTSTRSDPDSAFRESRSSQGSGISIPPSQSLTNMALSHCSTDGITCGNRADHHSCMQPDGPTQGSASPPYSGPSPRPSTANPWVPPRSRRRRPPPKHPHVTVETVCAYRRNGKKEDKDLRSLIENVKGVFAGRDQVILIDDHPSMYMLKQDLRNTCEALAAIVKEVDPNGIEVRFASRPSERDIKVKNATGMLSVFDKHFDTRNTGRHSLMAEAVRCILRDVGEASAPAQIDKGWTSQSTMNRRQSTRKSLTFRAATSIGLGTSPIFGPSSPVSSASTSSRPSGTTIYVVTDGVWGREECQPDDMTLGVAKHIQEFILGQQELGLARNSVVIQLINVGNDAVGTKRMVHLDDHLWSDYPQAHPGGGDMRGARWDIVDTKLSTAPLWSIFVGAIDKAEDERPSSAEMDGGTPHDAGVDG